jgi:serine/threonine protein kinase
MEAYVRGRRLRIDPSASKGKGGEADIYDIGKGLVAKIFKDSDHPDFAGRPGEQQGARQRIDEHQRKLRVFPSNLPPQVVTPRDLITNQAASRVLGYTMEFLEGHQLLRRFMDRKFRELSGIDSNAVADLFRSLHPVVSGLHARQVVIGDFNNLNVLVKGTDPRLIDADSMQFGGFLSKLYTKLFVDPRLCDPAQTKPVLARPHDELSDWYAYTVMLMQSLLFLDSPYSGVYRPVNAADRMVPDARPLRCISVFHPEVMYPKPATHYRVLPDDLLSLFHRFFAEGQREEFPVKVLDSLRWTKCTACGTEHARSTCPTCKEVAPAAQKEVTVVRGNIISSRIFQTSGTIVCATLQNDRLLWLYHESGSFRRENRTEVARERLSSAFRFRLQGEKTHIGYGHVLTTLAPGQKPDRLAIDTFNDIPMFDVNGQARYWLQNGQLFRDGELGSRHIGNVLSRQTLFWMGSSFGFGFYRAGTLNGAFVFDALRSGVNDQVKLPPVAGLLIDSTCVFAKDRCWFFTTSQEGGHGGGKNINRCTLIRSTGAVEATAEAEEGDGSWLGTIRGKYALGNFLLSPTDEGVIRVVASGSQIVEDKKFSGTENLVSTDDALFLGKEGLYVVGRNQIHLHKFT